MESNIVLQYILSGITQGSIYAIVAIGFNIIYNTTGIINFAQGEFLVLGSMIAISLASFLPLALAVLIACLATTLVGAALELVFIRGLKKWSPVRVVTLFLLIFIIPFRSGLFDGFPFLANMVFCVLIAAPIAAGIEFLFKRFVKSTSNVLRMIIITIGISILMREVMLHVWDEKNRALPFFTGNEVSSIDIFGAMISPQVLWVLGVSAVIVVGLNLFFKFTLIGKAMLACSDNKTAASLCGINVKWMVTLSFMISAGIGALAGCVTSPLTQTQYNMGSTLAIKGFAVAVLGGLGNSTGAVVAGLMLGVLEAFAISIMPNAYIEAISIVILLVILFFKPSGLFGSAEASRLKEF
ncbi:MAG: branched-chain amino acid ABC transporter permease [Spirochaetales bacterium]|nr:branched-chain amino acid ABC transporter permease [Spirochaetales bacterium]